MGTLYELLGALPSDDAEELRTAFRKAAKATHPDTNPDNPDAAVRFRELVRAYDILTDSDQRATYDHLLAIALQPPATQAKQTYETVRKVASNTMAATVISAVLVGGYTVFGLFSKPPGAAEMPADKSAGTLEVAALHPTPSAQEGPSGQRDAEITIGSAATKAAPAPAANAAAPLGRFEPVPAFATYNLGVQFYPRVNTAYFDRGVAPYRIGTPDRPVRDVTPVRRAANWKRTKTAARRPLMIAPAKPERREPLTVAITP